MVVGEDGKESLISILVDISQSKSAQEELRMTLERHRIIMEQSNDIIFEWDIARDYLSCSSNWCKKFGYQPIKEHVSKRMAHASHVHPEETPQIANLVKRIYGGEPYGERELRLADSEGRYRWCKIRTSTQFNEMGDPVKVVGVMADIDEEKRTAQVLIDQTKRDELTAVSYTHLASY